MLKKILNIFFIASTLILLASCNAAKESIEVVDQGRFKEPPVTAPVEPGNSDISLINSLVTLTKERLFPGEEAIITFIARDSDGVAINEGGLQVEFTFFSDGTSTGTFSATKDSGDGVYKATLTAVEFGSKNTIRVIVGGSTIIQLQPFQLQVISGDYYKEITLSSATDQDEFQVQVELTTSNFDYSKVQNNGEDIRFFDESFVEQDYWIEKWDTSGNSTIWVKVQESAVSKLIMAYGNDSISSASSVEEVFTYDVSKGIYYELSQASGGTNYNVSSYIDSNDVSILTNSGYSTQTLSSGSTGTFNDVISGLINVKGPISGRYLTYNDASDTVAPLSFASTILSYPKSRGTDDWDLYNPNSTAANLTLYNYDSSGALQGSNTYSIGAEDKLHIDYDVSKIGIIESDVPIIGLSYHSDASDGNIMMRPSTSIIGTAGNTGSVGIVEDGTIGTIYFSNGSTQSFTGDKGASIDFTGGSGQELALGVRIVANKGVTAVSQADSDGSDTTSFWPLEEMGNEYLVPAASQYVVIVCTETINLILTDPGGNDDSGVCIPSGGNNPGVIPFGSSTNVTFSAGTRVSGDANFFMYYEYEDEDETNLVSWKQARAYSPSTITTLVGDEQSWD